MSQPPRGRRRRNVVAVSRQARAVPQQVLRRRPVPGWCASPQRPLPAGTRPPQGWRLIPALTRRSGIELSMLDTAGKRVSRPVRNASNPASPSVTTRSR